MKRRGLIDYRRAEDGHSSVPSHLNRQGETARRPKVVAKAFEIAAVLRCKQLHRARSLK